MRLTVNWSSFFHRL